MSRTKPEFDVVAMLVDLIWNIKETGDINGNLTGSW